MTVQLNADVLEKIFQYLDFRSLCSAEMTCRHWKDVINQRRLYWQLSKKLSKLNVPKMLHLNRNQSDDSNNSAFDQERKRIRRYNYKPIKKRFKKS